MNNSNGQIANGPKTSRNYLCDAGNQAANNFVNRVRRTLDNSALRRRDDSRLLGALNSSGSS